MKYTKQDALVSLRPKASYTWVGDDYSGLNWLGSDSVPTDAEITAELNRLNSAEPVRLLREKRDELLAETDWVVTKASETGVAETTAWKTYRQALRDLPASSTPKVDSFNNLDLSSVTWPTKPS
jgi:hypothetical protein|tara:strand:- start:582 stop:953 length:372 start_codon:yes stop_codon:yes gene_type:complete